MAGQKGRSGRRPKPTAQKELEGTLRPDRQTADEVRLEPLATLPKAPSHLNADGKAEWKRMGGPLVAQQVLTQADLGHLEVVCISYQELLWAARMMEAEGRTVVIRDKDGNVRAIVRAPWCTHYEGQADRYLKAADRIGGNPSARTRVAAVGKRQEPQDAARAEWRERLEAAKARRDRRSKSGA